MKHCGVREFCISFRFLDGYPSLYGPHIQLGLIPSWPQGLQGVGATSESQLTVVKAETPKSPSSGIFRPFFKSPEACQDETVRRSGRTTAEVRCGETAEGVQRLPMKRNRTTPCLTSKATIATSSRSGSMSGSKSAQMSQEAKTAKMMLMILGVHVVSLLPFLVVITWRFVASEQHADALSDAKKVRI